MQHFYRDELANFIVIARTPLLQFTAGPSLVTYHYKGHILSYTQEVLPSCASVKCTPSVDCIYVNVQAG